MPYYDLAPIVVILWLAWGVGLWFCIALIRESRPARKPRQPVTTPTSSLTGLPKNAAPSEARQQMPDADPFQALLHHLEVGACGVDPRRIAQATEQAIQHAMNRR